MKLKFSLAILCATFYLNISAQDTTKFQTLEMREVLISGRQKTVKEHAEFKIKGQSTEILTLEELERTNQAFIEQSLGTMSGVQVDKRTQLGGQRIVIRGYGNDQKFNNWGIKAYYNGIPITNADGVTVMDDIDFSIVNNIEVVKGPATTLYGGGVGGVVRFYLKPSTEKGLSISQKSAFGSFGLIQSNTKLDYVTDKSAQFVSFGHIESNGYRPHGSSLKNNFTYYGEYKLSDKQKISAFLSQNFSHEEVTGQISYADYYAGKDPGNLAYIKKNARNNFQTTRFSLSSDYKFCSNFSNNTSLFFTNSDFKRVAAGADEMNMSPNYGFRTVFNTKFKIAPRISNKLEFGAEVQETKSQISNYRFDGTVDSIPLLVQGISKGSYFKYKTNQSSVFIHNRTNFESIDLSLIIGLSANHLAYSRTDLLSGPGLVSGYNKDLSFNKSFDISLNPHIALQKTIKNQIINLSYSEGINAPTAATAFIGTINKSNDSLVPEKARMFDLSVQGLLFKTNFDYQISLFSMNVTNKLTQLSGAIPSGGTYTYWANTGSQLNRGIEASIGYSYHAKKQTSFLSKISAFINTSYYDFKYTDFSTKIGSAVTDYSKNVVVGVPTVKYALGLDVYNKHGIYINSTYNYLNGVYTDFANTNKVDGYGLLSGKIGFKKQFLKKLELDVYAAGNNLTSQINYTFLFLGNNANDTDPGSGYPASVTTDVNPGVSKAYFWGGVNLKYHF